MTSPLEFNQGTASSSWRFTAADGTTHLLTLATCPGGSTSATGADLRYVPMPAIEVRTLPPGASITNPEQPLPQRKS